MCLMIIILLHKYFPSNPKIVKSLKYINARVMRKMIIYRHYNLKRYVLQNPCNKAPLMKLNLSSLTGI